jgi:glycosyltransferase involved in cell wall biosynthesis
VSAAARAAVAGGLLALALAAAAEAARPEPPREVLDPGPVAVTGRTLAVAAGGDLQAALERAGPGDAIVLEAGARFTGPFTLPRKEGPGWITIRSSGAGSLAAGRRVTPADRARLATLLGPDGRPALRTAPGAHHYRLVGLELAPSGRGLSQGVVLLGAGDEREAGRLPHHVVLRHCWIHGDPEQGGKRGVALNGAALVVEDSYLADFKAAGLETQALAGWNGPGPFRIVNSYVEAAGVNLLLGGADPRIPDLVPADVEIRGNHFAKPPAWNRHDRRAYRGTAWAVKNLLELKSARRVVIEGNLLEHTWVDAQPGFAVQFTVRNQEGGAPWSVIEDVAFRGNVVRAVAGGVNVLGRDDNHPSRTLARLLIADNLFEDVGGVRWGGNGRWLQLTSTTADVVVDHNTALHTGNVITVEGVHRGFVFTNNVAPHNEYGVTGTGVAFGLPTLRAAFPGVVFRRNVLAGARSGDYPADNFFPRSLDAVGFARRAAGDYTLGPRSPYRGQGTDGRDPGADGAAVTRARAARDGTALAAPAPAGGRWWAEAVLWTSVAGLAYVYAGYPLLVAAWARWRPRPRRRAPIEPTVSVLIAACDEAARIEARLANLRALDYPRPRLEVLLGSDGSTDGTAERARGCAGEDVRVLAFADRRGKPAVLNDLARAAHGEILVFGDARQRWAPDALRALVAGFADPEVGAVSGELILTEDDASVVGEGVGAYWRYEKAIRAAESAIDSTVGATGAIYAVRRELYEPMAPDTILDDVLVPLAVVRQGRRVVFEPAARAFDRVAASAREEFTRKVRTIGGNFQLFATQRRWLLHPGRNRLFLQTVSHKGLRLLSPLLVLAAFVANAALADRPLYATLLVGQAAFYAAAGAGAVAGARGRRPALLAVPYVFCLLNDATLVAFARFVRGRQRVTWEPAAPGGAR